MRWRHLWSMIALAAVLSVIGWWKGWPSSIAEARFRSRLAEQSTQSSLDIAALMPGDWELVCDAHGYGGEVYVNGKRYPPVGDMQDGAWGLLFISHDGSYTTAAGNCRTTNVNLFVPGWAYNRRNAATPSAYSAPAPATC